MRPNVFAIPPNLPFLDALVAGITAQAGPDPLALASYTILLPTRRACRSLREAFLRANQGKAQLLPRMSPVGDVDAAELTFAIEEPALEGGGLDIPPALPDLRRRLLLTRLVLAWAKDRPAGSLAPGQAAPLAAELARFLDEVQTEGCDLSGLGGLVPEDYAAHWQQTLQFLTILTENWPRVVEEEGALDPATRRNRLLAAQVEAWRRSPPSRPVIAAGIGGGVPAIDDLVAAVAFLPKGSVVLAGLDRETDEESWEAIRADPTHPQHLLGGLLMKLGIEASEVRSWPTPSFDALPSARQNLLREILRPAAESDRWRTIRELPKQALDGLQRLDCPGPQEEAGVIALLLREQLTDPGKTAALVTPDRSLARRVAAELRRWDIEIDDSAGIPLNKTPPGVFLRLVLEMALEAAAPVPLLAALKHPIAAGGRPTEVFRTLVRRLEEEVLRGPRPAPGFDGLRAALGKGGGDLLPFIADLERNIAPLLEALAQPKIELAEITALHIRVAEALAASDSETGPARLWREGAGETAAEFLNELLTGADGFPVLRAADYPPLFEALLSGSVVRPRFGRHPRLAIWGLLEARLQSADLIVLGGLNEGVWPPQAPSDPWLSRPMRRGLGMPAPERRIGLAAHDFAQASAAPRLVLTRATRVEGTPTVPSRWLLRLDTVLRAAKLDLSLDASQTLLRWQEMLDRPKERIELRPPEPRPPVEARPRKLSVTQVETWMRDPYGIYARHILGLKALDPLDADPGVAERGEFIHEALDLFTQRFPKELPPDAVAQLLEIGHEAFGAALSRPGVRAFWWPRFERIADWFVTLERARRLLLVESRTELTGELILDAPAGAFKITGKADRVDRLREGGLSIVDYKTGGVPRAEEVALGYSPQLPLEAAIAEKGGFPGIPAETVAALDYWRLTGGDPPGEVKSALAKDSSLRELIDGALNGLAALVERFDDAATPYLAQPWPDKAPRYTDYAHLARIKEWLTLAEGGE